MKFDKSVVQDVIAVAAGAFLGKQFLKTDKPEDKSYVMPAALAIGGVLIASQKGNPMLKSAGIAAASAGAIKLVELGVDSMMKPLAGLGNVEYYPQQAIGAVSSQLVQDVNGNLYLAQTSGVGDTEQTYGADELEGVEGADDLEGVEGTDEVWFQ